MDTNGKENLAENNDSSYPSRLMAMGGYVLLGVTAGLVFIIGVKYYNGSYPKPIEGVDNSIVVHLLKHYTYEVLVLVGAVITGYFALRLLFGANAGTVEVIPQKDRKLLEPLISAANKDAINQYVILSSLSGFTGTFQKIGFSGLPLATVTLTLIFSFLSFFQSEFMELAKLTLGAFIGSFVQKGQDQLSMAKQENEIGT